MEKNKETVERQIENIVKNTNDVFVYSKIPAKFILVNTSLWNYTETNCTQIKTLGDLSKKGD